MEVLSVLWPAALGLPLLAAALLAAVSLRRPIVAAAPWLTAPALALAVLVQPDTFIELPWLLLGTRLGLDETGRIFLLFTSALWMAAGRYARGYLAADPKAHRFFGFFLASMAGNVGVILSGDVVSFYFFFALMSFASYGLVVHDGARESRQAGRVYIGFVVAGEVLLFVGIVGIAGLTESVSFPLVREALSVSESRGWLLFLVLLGFGIKTAAVPLHMWLPLAYRAAPIPGGAVLSGPMIKAGLLGWLRFLPLGTVALPALGAACLAAGVISAFWGVAVGLAQKDPKAALGYSSISQMGLIAMGVGAGLLAPGAWPLILPALWIYALHHAVAKATLFLGVGIASRGGAGIRGRGWVAAGLVLPALALAGVPFSSGAAAKVALKGGLEAALPAGPVDWVLSCAALGTTLLMARFLVLAWPARGVSGDLLPRSAWSAWVAALGGVALAAWLVPWRGFPEATRGSIAWTYLWSTFWPPAVGGALAWSVWRSAPWSRRLSSIRIPAGDVLPYVLALGGGMRRLALLLRPPARAAVESRTPARDRGAAFEATAARLESALQRWEFVGVAVVALAAALMALMADG